MRPGWASHRLWPRAQKDLTATGAKNAKKELDQLKLSGLSVLGGSNDELVAPTWLKGEALAYARSISYFPWRQIIRQSIEAREQDLPQQVRDKLRPQCECCSLPGGDIPFLEAMLAVESDESLKVVAGYQGEALVDRMTEGSAWLPVRAGCGSAAGSGLRRSALGG